MSNQLKNMEKKGFTIAHYEQNLPSGAVIDEVRYKANGGQRVNYVIGTVKLRVQVAGGHVDKVVMVTWDGEGLCRLRSNNERLPEFDIKMGAAAQVCAAPDLFQAGKGRRGGE